MACASLTVGLCWSLCHSRASGSNELTGPHDYTDAAVQDMTWREARRLEKGLTDGEPGGHEWEEREVEEMCKQLGKTWGTLHDSKVELFLRALQRWDRRLQERAASEWAQDTEEEEADF